MSNPDYTAVRVGNIVRLTRNRDGYVYERSAELSNIEQIEEANRRGGQYFFSPATLKFFKSRVSPIVYGGNIFVTSEKGPDEVRRYSVRQLRDDSSIETLGNGFGGYASSSAAHYAARKYAAQQ